MSHYELALETRLKQHGLPLGETEYRFHPKRKWRFDRAWPDIMLAVEIDGGMSEKGSGRHGSPDRAAKDFEKRNTATLMGWRVLQFTGEQVSDDTAIAVLDEALKAIRLLGWTAQCPECRGWPQHLDTCSRRTTPAGDHGAGGE